MEAPGFAHRGVFRCPGLTLGFMRERYGGLMQAETGLPLFLYFRSEADANSPTPMASCRRNQSGPVVNIVTSSSDPLHLEIRIKPWEGGSGAVHTIKATVRTEEERSAWMSAWDAMRGAEANAAREATERAAAVKAKAQQEATERAAAVKAKAQQEATERAAAAKAKAEQADATLKKETMQADGRRLNTLVKLAKFHHEDLGQVYGHAMARHYGYNQRPWRLLL